MTEWKKLITIAALPRSGTTVTTALLGAHSRVHPIFEPWNAHRQMLDAKASMPWSDFVARFAAEPPAGKDVLLVKETSTDDAFIERIDELLRTTPSAVDRRLLVLARNPFHVFLSSVQARRDWWGAPDTVADADTFTRWVRRNRRHLKRLGELSRAHDALVVSYDRLTTQPNMPHRLTQALGIAFEQGQLTCDRKVDPEAIRGDVGLSQAPRPLSDASVEKRQAEFQAIKPSLEHLPEFRWAIRQRRAINRMPALATFGENADTLTEVFDAD